MPNVPMTVVETPQFLQDAKANLHEDERNELISFLASHPESGVIMPETGGVRKLRWARQGSGTSGGFRVIYYFHSERILLFLLAM